jgi:hypothetical protein
MSPRDKAELDTTKELIMLDLTEGINKNRKHSKLESKLLKEKADARMAQITTQREKPSNFNVMVPESIPI